MIPGTIPKNIRHGLLQQIPTLIRSITTDPKRSRDACTVTSTAFAGLRFVDFYKHFRAAALYTNRKVITAMEHRYQLEKSMSVAKLSPPSKHYCKPSTQYNLPCPRE